MKDTFLTMYSKVIEHSQKSSSNSADDVKRFLSESLVNYKVGNPFLSGGVRIKGGSLYWHRLLGIFKCNFYIQAVRVTVFPRCVGL